MDGTKFINKLKALGVPGCEELNGQDFDYLFLGEDENDSTVEFWKWFVSNVSTANLFLDEELESYEQLKKQNEILSAEQLEQLESCMEMLTTTDEFGAAIDEELKEEDALEEISKLEAELEDCKHRRDIVRLEKMEMQNNLHKLQEGVKTLEQQVTEQTRQIRSESNELTQTKKSLMSMVENIAATFTLFADVEEKETIFFSQLPISRWKEEEEKFTKVLSQFVDKQFKEGIDQLSIHNKSSDSMLLDSENGDIHLIRGPNQEEYKRNTNELNRISKMIELSEIEVVEAQVELSRVEGKLEEGRRILKLLKTNSLPPVSILQEEEMLKSEETLKCLEAELSSAMTHLCEQASQVAGWERTKALSATYDVKLNRQKYFLKKINYVEDLLLNQHCRQNFVKMLYNSDESILNDVFKELNEINTSVDRENVEFSERMNAIAEINEREKKLKEGQLEPDAINLLNILGLKIEDLSQNQRGDLKKTMQDVSLSLESTDLKVKEISSYSVNILNKIHSSANALEACVSGSEGNLPTLPLMKLDGKIGENQAKLVDQVCSFRQDAIHLLKEFEEKKKMLNLECSAEEKLLKWANDMSKKT